MDKNTKIGIGIVIACLVGTIIALAVLFANSKSDLSECKDSKSGIAALNEEYYVYPTEGFSNRLRVIMAFKTLQPKLNKKIKVYWDNKDCDNFLDIFQPIHNIDFVTPQSKYNYIGYESYPDILKKYGMSYSYNKEIDVYKNLKLLPKIQNIVDNFIRNNSLKDGISLHIRRTDHSKLAKNKGKYTTDEDFYNFIELFPSNTPIFLATDNLNTQLQFLDKYRGRIYVYKMIYPTKNLRQTSLKDSVIDIFICSKIKNFKGSGYSSFSDTIKILKN